MLSALDPCENSDELITRKLTSQAQIICAGPDYIATYGEPKTVEELQYHWGIIGLDKGQPVRWMVRHRGVERYLSIRSRFEFGDAESMIECCLSGLGICQLPSSVVRKYCVEGRLIPLLTDSAPSVIDLHAVWPKVSNMKPSIRYLVDQLLELARLGKLG